LVSVINVPSAIIIYVKFANKWMSMIMQRIILLFASKINHKGLYIKIIKLGIWLIIIQERNKFKKLKEGGNKVYRIWIHIWLMNLNKSR